MCHAELGPGQSMPKAESEEVLIPLGDEQMPALLMAPAAEPAGAVLVVPDMYGRTPFYERLAALLAAAGHEALLVEPFFRLPPLEERTAEAAVARRGQLDEAGTLDDLGAALDWLRQREGFPGRVGVIGFCMGGTFALDLAARHRDLATVAYYGFPVPQSFLVNPPPAPLEEAPRMSGPILAFWGDQDEVVGGDNVDAFTARMAELGQAFEFEIVPGQGHGFLAAAKLEPGSEDPVDRTWSRSVDFFGSQLRAVAVAG